LRTNSATNSTERKYGEGNSGSPTEEFIPFLCNSKIHYCVHKLPSLAPKFKHHFSLHSHTLFIHYIFQNCLPMCAYVSQAVRCHRYCRLKCCYSLLIATIRATFLAHFTVLDFITLTKFWCIMQSTEFVSAEYSPGPFAPFLQNLQLEVRRKTTKADSLGISCEP
jgi:hypothetical protein